MKEQEEIEQRFKHCEPMIMSGSDWQSFKKATLCHICKKELADIRVRDHYHVTGKFRGAAHNDCNINYKFTGRIPMVFHNLRGYDSHLIMQAIRKVEGKQLNCIANNMEKYISFSLGCMDFIDSLQFMSSSLQKLVENLAKEDVLALADVFENFREICLNYYGLDAAHLYTSPGLASQTALKMTGVKLELLTDVDMHLFIEKGLRGGISMISHRHAKANNKYVPNYDPNQSINHVMYLDADGPCHRHFQLKFSVGSTILKLRTLT
ncbi:Hypothetical predicted protein [Mytilus galloprovincialis]|uniref:DNA-directed DNA polymerase n=1 Tax=Mytilus galloprovincialis TaxID=29158 RepID=A0A8B6EGD7_MYTGA|nr:Hypothetical predicted protein [Mytilus galloprovincialis]